MIVTDNNAKAKKVISQMGAEVKVEKVIAVEMPTGWDKCGKRQSKSRMPGSTFTMSTEAR